MADQTLELPEIVTYPDAPSVVLPSQSSQLRIRAEHGLLILLMTLIFLVRVTNIQYNTLFVDEAIYSNLGEETLQGVFIQAGTGWIFGSYLYPSTAAIANKLGGVVGFRLYSAVLVTIAAWFVYLAARQVFDRQAALWTLLLFGLTGVSISLGQFAVIDVMCVPLLAIALYYLLQGVQSTTKHQKLSFAVAGFAFALSVLSKYIALLCLPALVISVAWYCLMRGESIRSIIFKLPWLYFILPVVIILGAYGLLYFKDLMQVFSGAYSTQHEERLQIISETWEEIGTVAALGIIGASILAVQILNHYNARKPRNLLLVGVAVAVFIGAALSIPIYQTLTANVRSLWKHDVYCLIFLAPLAGYFIATLLDRFTLQRPGQMVVPRIVAAVITGLGLYWFVNQIVGLMQLPLSITSGITASPKKVVLWPRRRQFTNTTFTLDW